MPTPRVLAVHVKPREAQVLSLLAQGCANEEIGVTLGLETSTVKHHINSAAGKLHVHSRILLARNWSCELFRIGAGRDDRSGCH
jgi:DNA-binding NarL/FixJ family response regulator